MKERVATAVVLLIVLFFFTWLGGTPFTIFIGVVLAIAGYEWCRLFKKGGYSPNTWLVVIGIIGYISTSLIGKEKIFPFFLIIYLFVTLAFAIKLFDKDPETAVLNLLIQFSGMFYVSEFGLSFIRLRNLQDGGLWLIFFVALTALGDTAALFIGKPWGAHKFKNQVSPNKSWEGVAAGVITAGITCLLVSLFASDWFMIKPIWAVIFGVVLYSVSIIGDLAISMIKRWAGEKNSSELLPGHGGILDRIDTHLWSATLGYYILIWLVF